MVYARVKFYFWDGGAFVVNDKDEVIRYSTGTQYKDNRAGCNFEVVSSTGKNRTEKVLIGDKFRLRYLIDGDEEETKQEEKFVFLGEDSKLYVGNEPGEESSTFEIRIKHAEKCPHGKDCLGRPVSHVDTYGQKLIHSKSGGTCGGDRNEQSVCGKSVGSWRNYQLSMGG
eukprot:gene22734-29899_t